MSRPYSNAAMASSLAIALTAAPSICKAQVAPLAPIVVTGSRHPDASSSTQPDLSAARAQIEQTAGAVGVVNAEQYSEGRVSTLGDALGSATGVMAQPRFGAEEARISIRGSGLQRTFHGRGLKLMQDGVPLNLADGSFDFQAVEALSARYVLVWRGANALQYGAANLGGAIDFVSPSGYNADRFRARAEAGSFGYQRLHASAGDVVGPFDYFVSASGFTQDGFRAHAHQNTQRLFANLGWRVSPRVETRFYLGSVNSISELPGSITKAQLRGDARAPNPGNVSGDQHRDIDWTRISNRTVYRDGTSTFEMFAYASQKQLLHPIFQVIRQDNVDYGVELRYTRQGELAGLRNEWTVGFAPSRGTTDEQRFVNAAGQPGAQTNASAQRADNMVLYGENRLTLMPRVTVIAGLQAVRSTRELADGFIAATPADPVSESFTLHYKRASPKLGLRYDWTPQVQFFANVSGSFEPPSFSELAGGAVPNLNRAQRATTFEAGTRGRLAGIEWDVAFYEARLKDELLQVATNSIGANITVNAGKTLHRGIEAGLSGYGPAGPMGRLEWRVNGVLNDFRFRGDNVFGNNALPGLPRHFGRGQLGWRLNGGTLIAVNVEASSGYAIDFANTLRADSYAIWGLRLAGSLTNSLSWFAEGRNLADRRYAATTGVVRNAGGIDTAQFFPGDGRAFYAGLDWKFN